MHPSLSETRFVHARTRKAEEGSGESYGVRSHRGVSRLGPRGDRRFSRLSRYGGFLILAAIASLAPEARTAEVDSSYVVVASRQTAAAADWRQVIQTIVAKHKARVIVYNDSVEQTLPSLRQAFPRYACFVARPDEATRELIGRIHRLTRQLDDDPYTDCLWGVVTGYDATAALRIARQAEPLTVRKVAAGTEFALQMVDDGVWYSERDQGRMVRKPPGEAPIEQAAPGDTTGALVSALNEYQPDLFITSGHATERDWQIGFGYRNGSFRCADGRLFGLDTQGRRLPIESPNPKVYLPIGNCLVGHIDGRDCLALAWMNSGGVCQMLGYTVPTWYGYMGWGVLDYFVEQPGRYTLTEAFFANQHALIHRLATCFPELLDRPSGDTGRLGTAPPLGEAARSQGLTATDAVGLLFDRDAVAFYGDPAWSARMAECPQAFAQSLTQQGDRYVFEITPLAGTDSFEPINTNGSQRGGRPFVAYLPRRVTGVRIVEGSQWQPVVSDDFILTPRPSRRDGAPRIRVVFEAQPR